MPDLLERFAITAVVSTGDVADLTPVQVEQFHFTRRTRLAKAS